MNINIGDNNKINKSNIGNEDKVTNIENNQNKTTHLKFYQKEGFWSGVLTGVISSLIASGIIWAITELIKGLIK